MSKVFNLKAGDSVRFWNRERWWKIAKSELQPEEVGIARTIRLYFEAGGAGSYCHDGEVSGSTHERYFHDIAEIQTREQENEVLSPGTKLIAEYPTWQEAVNSKEFKGE